MAHSNHLLIDNVFFELLYLLLSFWNQLKGLGNILLFVITVEIESVQKQPLTWGKPDFHFVSAKGVLNEEEVQSLADHIYHHSDHFTNLVVDEALAHQGNFYQRNIRLVLRVFLIKVTVIKLLTRDFRDVSVVSFGIGIPFFSVIVKVFGSHKFLEYLPQFFENGFVLFCVITLQSPYSNLIFLEKFKVETYSVFPHPYKGRTF